MTENLLCSLDTNPRHVVPPYWFIVRRETGDAFYVIGFEISGFTRPHVIGFVADLFFSTLESGLIFSGFAVEFAGCVWTVSVSGKKKLRIRKYPDTCGRGLNCILILDRNSQIWPWQTVGSVRSSCVEYLCTLVWAYINSSLHLARKYARLRYLSLDTICSSKHKHKHKHKKLMR